MQIRPAVAAAPTAVSLPDRAATKQRFDDLAASMTLRDAELAEAAASNGFIEPKWHRWFSETSTSLLQARDAFMQLVPPAEHQELLTALGQDIVDLGIGSGLLKGANASGKHFGAGWDTTLDRKIDDVRRAADLLA